MSQFRDVIARMAVDAEFARYARSHPDEVAAQFGLTPDEADKLRGLADASAASGPQALGARLSKSGTHQGVTEVVHGLPGSRGLPALPGSGPCPNKRLRQPRLPRHPRRLDRLAYVIVSQVFSRSRRLRPPGGRAIKHCPGEAKPACLSA